MQALMKMQQAERKAKSLVVSSCDLFLQKGLIDYMPDNYMVLFCLIFVLFDVILSFIYLILFFFIILLFYYFRK